MWNGARNRFRDEAIILYQQVESLDIAAAVAENIPISETRLVLQVPVSPCVQIEL